MDEINTVSISIILSLQVISPPSLRANKVSMARHKNKKDTKQNTFSVFVVVSSFSFCHCGKA
jgi:hypothetical protein